LSGIYTPGLKAVANTIVKRRRVLPVPSEVLVKEGERVSDDTVIARSYIPGDVVIKPLAYIVGVEPSDLPRIMVKKVGEKIEKGEILAVSKAFMGIFKKEYRSPTTGKIEMASEITGSVAIREPPVPIEMKAYISGQISEVIPQYGAVVKARAALVQGIFGIGGERQGNILVIAGPEEELTDAHLGKDVAGCVLVGGSLVTADFLVEACGRGVAGIVAGGVGIDDLSRFLGYQIGVAVTGNEAIDLTCIITEGFGRMNMAEHTYSLLKSLEGRRASINGTTQIRAGVIRPEIIVPTAEVRSGMPISQDSRATMSIGTRVRVIRQPYFGALGHVSALPTELRKLESESYVRVVNISLDDGRTVTVPRANVELVEE
jgi:hypothetical protein